MKCLVCSRECGAQAKVIVLTDAERLLVPNPLDQYVYCLPCWGVLADPRTGPALMSGIAQHHLKELGVANVGEKVARYRADLTSKALHNENKPS